MIEIHGVNLGTSASNTMHGVMSSIASQVSAASSTEILLGSTDVNDAQDSVEFSGVKLPATREWGPPNTPTKESENRTTKGKSQTEASQSEPLQTSITDKSRKLHVEVVVKTL